MLSMEAPTPRFLTLEDAGSLTDLKIQLCTAVWGAGQYGPLYSM